MPSRTTWAPLSEEQLEARRLVHVNAETVTHTSSTDIPYHYGPEQDDTWNLARFKQNLKVDIHQNDPYDSVFSLAGVDASIANAFRRILLAEVPTLAIEDVYIWKNTSIIQDEVLAHRLGLIPLTASSKALKWMTWYKKPPPKDDFAAQAKWEAEEGGEPASVPADYNTVVLTLDIKCRWATEAEDGRDGRKIAQEKGAEATPEEKYVNSNVYASSFKYESTGKQANVFVGERAVRPFNPDILIAKLRPGQAITVRCHCIKGIGMDHAKFSPVATASYRLLPHIDIKAPITGADAQKFQCCFPKGVIKLEKDPDSDEQRAVVADPMKDTVSRECLRHHEFKDKVKLGRIRDHFIFSVESTGQFESDELFLDSVRLLKSKAEKFKRHLEAVMEGN